MKERTNKENKAYMRACSLCDETVCVDNLKGVGRKMKFEGRELKLKKTIAECHEEVSKSILIK